MATDRIFEFNLWNGTAVASAGNAVSGICDLQHVKRTLGLRFKAASATGTASVKVQMAASNDNSNYDSYDDRADLMSDNITAFASNTEGYNLIPVPDPLDRYVKFKVTGLAANPADTLIYGKLVCQES